MTPVVGPPIAKLGQLEPSQTSIVYGCTASFFCSLKEPFIGYATEERQGKSKLLGMSAFEIFFFWYLTSFAAEFFFSLLALLLTALLFMSLVIEPSDLLTFKRKWFVFVFEPLETDS